MLTGIVEVVASKTDGSLKVKCMSDEFKAILRKPHNLLYDHGDGLDLVEVTTSKVDLAWFKIKKKKTNTDETATDEKKPIKKPVTTIRIGKGKIGEKIKASLQARDDVKPPSICNLRRPQRTLDEEIKPHLRSLYGAEEDKIKAIMEWVDMAELKEDMADSGS